MVILERWRERIAVHWNYLRLHKAASRIIIILIAFTLIRQSAHLNCRYTYLHTHQCVLYYIITKWYDGHYQLNYHPSWIDAPSSAVLLTPFINVCSASNVKIEFRRLPPLHILLLIISSPTAACCHCHRPECQNRESRGKLYLHLVWWLVGWLELESEVSDMISHPYLQSEQSSCKSADFAELLPH